jgi:transcriptional regulator with XRE-family HTH domain
MTVKDPRLVAFGEAMKRERQRAGLSQETLAAEANVSRAATSALERGVREPKLFTILALSRAMSITPGQLLEGLDKIP